MRVGPALGPGLEVEMKNSGTGSHTHLTFTYRDVKLQMLMSSCIVFPKCHLPECYSCTGSASAYSRTATEIFARFLFDSKWACQEAIVMCLLGSERL